MKLQIFCRCRLFPSWSGLGLISTPVHEDYRGLLLLISINNESSLLNLYVQIYVSQKHIPDWNTTKCVATTNSVTEFAPYAHISTAWLATKGNEPPQALCSRPVSGSTLFFHRTTRDVCAVSTGDAGKLRGCTPIKLQYPWHQSFTTIWCPHRYLSSRCKTLHYTYGIYCMTRFHSADIPLRCVVYNTSFLLLPTDNSNWLLI